MGAAPKDWQTPVGDEKTGKAVLGHFQLNSTGLEYARIVWGGSHSILATDGIQNFWVPPFSRIRLRRCIVTIASVDRLLKTIRNNH
jgi:hypothetical protein